MQNRIIAGFEADFAFQWLPSPNSHTGDIGKGIIGRYSIIMEMPTSEKNFRMIAYAQVFHFVPSHFVGRSSDWVSRPDLTKNYIITDFLLQTA